jgi:hypothetical protein
MTAQAHTELLERRLRRLLSWYPPRHRAVYEEEMLTVAMDQATPGQRRPSLAEAFSLVKGGLSARFEHGWRGLRTSEWHEAVKVFVVLASALLAAVSGGTLVRAALIGMPFGVTPGAIAMTIGWSLVLIAACLDRRLLVAAGAALGAAGQAVLLIVAWASFTLDWWPFVLAVVTAVAAALVVRSPARPTTTPGRTRLAALAMAVLVLASFALEALGSVRYVVQSTAGNDGQVRYTWSPDVAVLPNRPWVVGAVLVLAPLLAAAGIAVATVLRRPGPVRRRLVLLAVPVGLAAVMTFDGRLPLNSTAPAAQWTILALVSALGAVLAGLTHTRYEELLRLRRAALRPAAGQSD